MGFVFKGPVREALALEGLSENTKKHMVADIYTLREQYREASRVFPTDSIHRTRLGLKHVEEAVREINKACPNKPLYLEGDVISFKTKSGWVKATLNLDGSDYQEPPHIQFLGVKELMAIPLVFRPDAAGRAQGDSSGGEVFILFDPATGRFKSSDLVIYGYQSPLPRRLLESHLPVSMLKSVTQYHSCQAH